MPVTHAQKKDRARLEKALGRGAQQPRPARRAWLCWLSAGRRAQQGDEGAALATLPRNRQFPPPFQEQKHNKFFIASIAPVKNQPRPAQASAAPALLVAS